MQCIGHLDHVESNNSKPKQNMSNTNNSDLGGDYGSLYILSTGEFLRPATLEEYTAAWMADCGWVISIDKTTCYIGF